MLTDFPSPGDGMFYRCSPLLKCHDEGEIRRCVVIRGETCIALQMDLFCLMIERGGFLGLSFAAGYLILTYTKRRGGA